MPILSKIGHRTWNQRLTRGWFYLLLTLGALTILYPMLLVFGQAMSNRFDLRDNALVPRYLFDPNELALKHLFSYSRRINLVASRHRLNAWSNHGSMKEDTGFLARQPALLADQGFPPASYAAVREDFHSFVQTLDPGDVLVKEFRVEDFYYDFVRRRYQAKAEALRATWTNAAERPAWFVQQFPDARERARAEQDLDALALAVMNHEFRTDYPTLLTLEVIPPGNITIPVWRLSDDPKGRMWRDFVRELPAAQKLVISSDTYWHEFLRTRYDDDIARLNANWGTSHEGFFELRFPFEPPAHAAIRRDWDDFLVKRWPRRLLSVPPSYAPQWRAVVREKLAAHIGATGDRVDADTLAELARLSGQAHAAWADVPLPARRPANDTLGRFWSEFTFSGAIPAADLQLDAPELAFPRFLRERYGAGRPDADALAALNARWNTAFARFEDIPLPLVLDDYVEVTSRVPAMRASYALESFQRVTDYMVGRGRAVQNTVYLILLSLIAALTINPLAAYSLSRFSMKQSHKILTLFLATMAFPPAVSMIPVFLLLRDMNLLNTFAALVFPTIANGYSIFLLKCFFDSLPRELYEAAEMDGASEAQTFRLVAMPLIKPILAYIALMTFVNTYNGFMWAFVICPDQEMWTIMVWVFDFQSRNPGFNYVMASVLLASIFPLIIFLMVNKIIMRGIMIPQMK